MKLVLSGGESIFENKPISRLIEVSDLFDIDYLDLWHPKNTMCDSMEEISESFKKNNKKVVCITTWSHLCSENNLENEKKKLIESIEIAKYFGAPRVNTYFGHMEARDDEKAINIYIDALSSVLEIAKKNDIVICLENEFDSRGNDPECSDITRSADSLLSLVKKVGSPYFRITYDPSNFNLAQEEEYPYAYEILKDYIDYIHIKNGRKYINKTDDNQRIWSDHGRNYIFCPIDEGAVDYRNLIRKCEEYNPDWLYAFEPHITYKDDKNTALLNVTEEEKKVIEFMGVKLFYDYRSSINAVKNYGGF